MNNKYAVALISALNSNYANIPITPKNLTPVQITHRITKNINAQTVKHIITKEQENIYSNIINEEYIIEKNINSLIEKALEIFKNYENVIILYSDSPLNDPEIINKLIELHEDEMAEYSFTENFPDGIGGEIVNYQTLKTIGKIIKSQNIQSYLNKKAIEKIINLDINNYDVEVLVSDTDFRKERLELNCQNKRNYLIVKKALEYLNYKDNISVNDIETLINQKPEFMRSIPAYIEIEITNECNFVCTMCPRTNVMNRNIKNMNPGEYKTILKKLAGFTEEAFISLSLMGEPFLHPDIMNIIKNTLKYKEFSLIIETNGTMLSKEIIDELKEVDTDNKLYIILAVDSPNKELFQKLRPHKEKIDCFDKIDNNAFYLLAKGPTNSYLQILRLKENNKVLDDFYKKWQAFKDKIILQKYNPYQNRMSDRKGVDLAPLNRFPCWHLKRDLTILNDGSVSFCKQDINGEKIQGNILKEDIKTVWEKVEQTFIEDHKGNIDPFCEKCDEWFTYNF